MRQFLKSIYIETYRVLSQSALRFTLQRIRKINKNTLYHERTFLNYIGI